MRVMYVCMFVKYVGIVCTCARYVCMYVVYVCWVSYVVYLFMFRDVCMCVSYVCDCVCYVCQVFFL